MKSPLQWAKNPKKKDNTTQASEVGARVEGGKTETHTWARKIWRKREARECLACCTFSKSVYMLWKISFIFKGFQNNVCESYLDQLTKGVGTKGIAKRIFHWRARIFVAGLFVRIWTPTRRFERIRTEEIIARILEQEEGWGK